MPGRFARHASPALEQVVRRIIPGATLLEVVPFEVDESLVVDEATAKGAGYGVPLKLSVREPNGAVRTLVFHTERSDEFGHDRRADRAADMLLAYDRFDRIPGHVQALDVGAIKRDGSGLVSVAGTGEFYLVTSFAEGHLYADDLRRIASTSQASQADETHCETLSRHLLKIHSEKYGDALRYRRAIRDLVGAGEGIFGLIDAYAADVPSASPERLQLIERRVIDWRWKIRGRAHRLARIHGDYHPFNVLLTDSGEVGLLDASRGCMGDPADDVTCMAINYVFFAVERPDTWARAFRKLWHRFWDVYLTESADTELLDVCAPFLAWRGLVVANPVWYPAVSAEARDRVLRMIETALSLPRFDPELADEVFG